MKRILTLGNSIMFLLFFTVILSLSSCKSTTKCPLSQQKKDSWLFTQTAESGSVTYNKSTKIYTVTLKKTNPLTVKFTDMPQRKASPIKTEEFAKDWKSMFGKEKPNATFVALLDTKDKGHIEEVAVCTILDISYNKAEQTLIYKVKELPGANSFAIDSTGKELNDIFYKFGPSIIFIDSAQEISSQGNGLQIKINNNNKKVNPEKIWVMIVGKDTKDSPFKLFLPPKKLSAINPEDLNVDNIYSGRVYISYNNPLPTDNPGYINPADPDVANIRYDWAEITYNPGDASSCANLTSVDQLGIPLSLKNKKGETRGYKKSFKNIISELKILPVNPDAQSPFMGSLDDGSFIRVLSPLKSPKSYTFFNQYMKKLEGKTITIKDVYSGITDPNHKPGTMLDYTGTVQNGGIIFHSNNGEEDVNLTADSLSDQHIADCNGHFTVNGKEDNFGNNDYYCVLYRDFLAGANLGYWGSVSSNQDWSTIQPFAGGGNLYAKTIYNTSNSYGFSFMDMEKRIKTLLSLDKDNANLTINILDDNATGGFSKVNQKTCPPVIKGTYDYKGVFFFSAEKAGLTFNFNGKAYKVPKGSGNSGCQIEIPAIPANQGVNKYPVSFNGINAVLDVTFNGSTATSIKWDNSTSINGGAAPTVNQNVVSIGGF
jgi:hypothetical protein